MSYAGRLVQMSRNAAPIGQPALRETIEQTEVEPAPAPLRTPAAATAVEDHPRRAAQTATTAAEPPVSTPRAIEHSVTERERTRVVEKLIAASTAAPPEIPAAPVVQPIITQREIVHEWLTERDDGSDPLESITADDEIRQLLRAVRGWTSDVPAAPELSEQTATVEIAAVEPLQATPVPLVQVTAEPAADPVQVSIGNVVITIEDAPSTPSARAVAAPVIDVGARLARHYWRER